MDQDNHIITLISMGFQNMDHIKKALRLGKNDINEAVAILTNEHNDYSLVGEDIDMKTDDASSTALVPTVAPPPYDLKNYDLGDLQISNSTGASDEIPVPTDPLQFPTANLYELESRVYVDRWSIPYKREESLGKCLISATYFAERELCEVDENCKRFIEVCLPEAFKKLLTTPAVRGWVFEVHDGIQSMLQLLVNLIISRLKYDPICIPLLQTLEMVFDPESEFNSKNKLKPGSQNNMSTQNAFASAEDFVDHYGWLVELINKFGSQGGFTEIRDRFMSSELNGASMGALLQPVAKCAGFLIPSKVCTLLSPCMDIAVNYIKTLPDSEIRSKDVCSILELLKTMKQLCVHLWIRQLGPMNSLFLEIILRMLNCQHFNSRMNALKEITKLIDECLSFTIRPNKTAIDTEELLNWLTENEILSIGLEGNIDQMQYMDKIKAIIEFIGHRLSLEELTKVWDMQNGQNAQVVDNIHTIMTAATSKFNAEQFDHLLVLTQNTWQSSNEQLRKRLISFIGRIGKETSQGKSSTKILDLVWDLTHTSSLSTYLVELLIDEHFSILSSVTHKDQTKKQYCVKCIEEIKKGTSTLAMLKLLHKICDNVFKFGAFKQERTVLNELNKTHEIIKMVTNSLARSHKQAVTAAGEGKLTPAVLVDGRYTHEDYLVGHLNFLQFLLQEGAQYLTWSRAKEIWDCLISNPVACDSDKEICFEWFTKCLNDMEITTQSQLFQQKLLHLDPAQLTNRGFICFKTYFESVNSSDYKLRRSVCLVVEKLELVGVDFLWQVVLSSNETISDATINYLLEINYHALTQKLKKDVVSLHKRFISECYKRLESVGSSLGATAMFTAVSSATKTLTAVSISEAASCPGPTRATRLLNLCRLLQVTERYISSIEEAHTAIRTILPHGMSFLGHPMYLKILNDNTKEEHIVVTHSNESLCLVRERIAEQFGMSASRVQMIHDELDLSREKNAKLIGQFPAIDKHVVTVKCPYDVVITGEKSYNTASSAASIPEAPDFSYIKTIVLDMEKQLPGVVSVSAGGQVFDVLYQLAALDDAKITAQVRTLLHLIPTNPAILDTLDSISAKKVIEISSPSESSKGSPHSSPKKFTVTSPNRQRCDSPKEILKNLFDVSTSISAFKLLYNLEILSGKLMPVIQDSGTLQSAKIFRKDFLSVGGLKLVLNILKKDSLSNDVDYNIQQSCYLTALNIARFLLCNQTGLEMNNIVVVDCCSSISPTKAVLEFPMHSAASSDICSDLNIQDEHKSIEDLNQTELLETLQSLMRIAWAAAAGNLHLANCFLPHKEGHFYCGRRSRQSSSGSTSSGSESGDGCSLHGGVCSQHHNVNKTDSLLACKSLKFLILCIQLRPDVFVSFVKLPCIRDFVIDVLLGSSCQEVRFCAMEQFFHLSQLKNIVSPSPKHYMLQLLLKAHLPLWVCSSYVRGNSQRLLDQCKEYFELCCSLLDGLTDEEQKSLNIDAKQMIEDEITWLQSFSPSSVVSLQSADSALITGHLKLVKTLLRCDGVKKEQVGNVLIPDLLQNFLFPASYLISLGTASSSNNLSSSFIPKCTTFESRVAAYDVLAELATGCAENLEKIIKQLQSMHHYLKPELVKEFEYEPLVAGRATCGYVGLKNAGATCYMNSVIQQLYMQPDIKELILSIDEDDPDENSLFYQFQMVFAHLLESQLEYHIPENFWRCFRLWGEPINVREQQDAFEFFTHLIDQIDEYLIKNNWDPVFKQKYEGLFSDQKICQGCPHRYEREESFMALNLPIKSHNLLDSLDQFVKGELLEGQNAYFCEKCHDKRNTIKRTCIKNLPPVLVIQLKRFDYDWEANRSLKFDDYFKFPWRLDMSPYTTEGIQEKESLNNEESMQDNQIVPQSATVAKIANSTYELVGVIVHSGQANAGHYYSYIKERKSENTCNAGRWFKFNDTTVEEFDMNEASLEAECFGGTYKAKVRDSNSSHPENRQRYWNGYLLFYERLEEAARTPRTPRKTPNKFSFRKSENDSSPGVCRNLFKQSPSNQSNAYRQRDSLSQLTRLVDRGERHGLFLDKMPARIEQMVREENLGFMHNCDIYNDAYFMFALRLASANMGSADSSEFAKYAVNSILPLSVNFLFNTYLRYKNKNSNTMSDWLHLIESTLSNSKEAAFWFIDFLGSDTGLNYFKPFLLECSNREVRQVFTRIVEKGISHFFSHGGEAGSESLDCIVVHLLDMLSQDVPDNCRSCAQYFGLLCTYAQLGTKTCAHMLSHKAFQKMLIFLLGPTAADSQSQEIFPRRWNSVQAQEFGSLHATMALLILNCDLVPHRSCDPENYPVLQSVWACNTTTLTMPDEISQALYGSGSIRYIHEVVSACREVGGSISLFVDMLVQCSFCCKSFSVYVTSQIMTQYSSVSSNELKNLSYLLLEILSIEDPLQFTRIQLVIDGSPPSKEVVFDGILSIIRANQANDSRRSYQGVKFLVTLAHKCSAAKDYLMRSPNKWQWSVNWLKKMMSERNYLQASSNVPLSNEDSNTKNFQRTTSAQDTLDEATALLTSVDSPDSVDITMDMDDEEEEKTDSPAAPVVLFHEEVVNDSRTLKRMHGVLDLDNIDY